MKQILGQKQTQSLKLTPQLRQSLEILQLSSQALEQKIVEELTQNPLLELDEKAISEPSNTDNAPSESLEQDWQPQMDVRRTNTAGPAAQSAIEGTATYHESLREYLIKEIGLTSLSPRDQMIAQLVIDSLDNDGYLKSSCDEIARLCPSQLGIETEDVNAVLSMVKSLEPAGVGASNLAERLSILIDRLPEETPAKELAKQITNHHLTLLAEKKFDQLQRKLSIDRIELAEAIELITAQNPRIAPLFSEDNWDQITPDIIVVQTGQDYEARLNPNLQTRLTINESYSQLGNSTSDSESSRYIRGHLNDAKVFISSINNRFDTLLRVAASVVAKQQGFFSSGVDHMTPLSRRQIAEELEMHDSTISRAVSGKYLQCKFGVFELAYFFSSSIDNQDGSAASSKTICNLIEQIINSEPKRRPYSDSKIAEQLSAQGYSIARRTVAKYRESMDIAPSSRRKSI
jgi:RNA polymerase sigma-54 factor